MPEEIFKKHSEFLASNISHVTGLYAGENVTVALADFREAAFGDGLNALFGNLEEDADFGNVTAKFKTIQFAGEDGSDNAPELKTGEGTGDDIQPESLCAVSNADDVNSMTTMSKSAHGWNAYICFNNLGAEVGGISSGNSLAGTGTEFAILAEKVSLFSRAPAGNPAREVYMGVQVTDYDGAIPVWCPHPRLLLTSDGTMVYAKRTSSFSNGIIGLLFFDPTTGAIFAADEGRYFASDTHWGMHARFGGSALPAISNHYNAFCGTIVAGGGHVFNINGANGPFMQIASDGVAIGAPNAVPSKASFSSVVFYLDESGGAGSPVLKYKVVSTNGTVVTGTV